MSVCASRNCNIHDILRVGGRHLGGACPSQVRFLVATIIVATALLLPQATPASPTSASLFEFDQDQGSWCICEDCCRSTASLRWDPLDWAGPYSQGSLLLEADLIDGDDQTECRVALQSSEPDGSLPPGVGRLGDFSFGIGAFACWLHVPDTTAVGAGGLRVRLFARTGDAANHPEWGDSSGWDIYRGRWVTPVPGWNRVWVRVDDACHLESGESVWGEIEYLDILQAVGVELASETDQAVAIHVDHYIATAVFDASIESVTWCGVPGEDCHGINDPFDVCMNLSGSLPDTLSLKGASISIRWRANQLELLSITEGEIWDAACKTISNAQGTAQIDCASYQPAGVRVSPSELLAAFNFTAERAGRCPYWITNVVLRDPDNVDILPDTTEGALGADYWFYLGDFTGDVFGGYSWTLCPDRDIDVFDLSTFSIHYGLVDTDPPFDCRTDIGPTSTGWIHGVPVLDGVIDFDDLSIFADSYAYQSGEMGLSPPPGPDRDWESLRASVTFGLEAWNLRSPEPGRSAGGTRADVEFRFVPAETTIFLGDSVWVEIGIAGNMGGFKTYGVVARYDPGIVELLDVKQGPLFFDSPHTTFFRNRSEGDSLDVIDSILGAGLTVSGSGSIVRFLFRGVGHGTSALHFEEALPANVYGLPIPAQTQDGSIQVIDLTGVGTRQDRGEDARAGITAAPNPTGGPCVFSVRLPGRERVGGAEIDLYDVRGRLIRRWDGGAFTREFSLVEWDGLDAAGRRVPAGVYFAVLRMGNDRFETKVILAN